MNNSIQGGWNEKDAMYHTEGGEFAQVHESNTTAYPISTASLQSPIYTSREH